MNKSGILTKADCLKCPALEKCTDLKVGSQMQFEPGNENCLVLRGDETMKKYPDTSPEKDKYFKDYRQKLLKRIKNEPQSHQ